MMVSILMDPENLRGEWANAFPGSGDFLGLQSDSSMTHVNLDHFGLGLGLL